MKKLLITSLFLLLSFPGDALAQVRPNYQRDTTEILKAEDARRYELIEKFLGGTYEEKYVVRAVLAAGRIGDDRAVPAVARLLGEGSGTVRTMAAFALGEIESIKAADAILKAIRENVPAETQTATSARGAETRQSGNADSITARLVEAAGKIAAANADNEKSGELREAILDVLESEDRKRAKQNRETVLLALTAALRAAPRDAKRERPDDTDIVVAKFLTNLDPRVRADAANTMTRIRAKNVNEALRNMLMSDDDAVARANAARALAAAEDKEALNILIDAATEDDDARVRVSAIRAVANSKDAKAAEKLLERAEVLLAEFKRSRPASRTQKSELLEIATATGRLLGGTNNARAVRFLDDFRLADNYESAETEIAFAQVSPKDYFAAVPKTRNTDERFWRQARSAVQGLAELAKLPDKGNSLDAKEPPETFFRNGVGASAPPLPDHYARALPDVLRAYSAFKPADLQAALRKHLLNADPFVRAAAAELLADQPVSKENIDALKAAFSRSLLTDKTDNDAQLAIMDALHKLGKKESAGSLLTALNARDYMVRKKAFELLSDKDLQKDLPGIPTSLENARAKHLDKVLPYSPASGTKLGQVLNSDVDYRRAAARKNGFVKATLITEKGVFTIDLLPEDAPLTIDNFIKLARANYFNGLEVHRVVPNFVMQDGDPRGDGNGGPGWSIRCEMNMVPYERGAVGMALSGKDTGGSQWFVTHSPQPHLDGGYTVFGRVNETGMKVVDKIVRGDKIVSVRIVEAGSTRRSRSKR